MNKFYFSKAIALFAIAAGTLFSCQNDDDGPSINKNIDFNNTSIVPPLAVAMSGFENLKISSLISSTDVLSQSPSFLLQSL